MKRRGLKRKLSGVVVAIAATTLGLTLTAAGDVTACGSADDPYTQSLTTAEACATQDHLQITPLSSNIALPGGGSEAVFDTPTGAIDQFFAPPGFDPLTATNEQLREYGFPPPPPTSSTEYPVWQAAMAAWQAPTNSNPSFLAASTDVKGTLWDPVGMNWDGYEIFKPAGTFSDTTMQYQQPITSSTTQCKNGDLALIWTGFDGAGSSNFVQAGTVVHGGHDGDAFYEVNLGPLIYAWNNGTLHIPQGDDAYVDVQYYSGAYHFFVEDMTKGPSVNASVSMSATGANVEAIIEAPAVGGQTAPGETNINFGSDLTNFQTLTVFGSWANSVGYDTYPPAGTWGGNGRSGTYIRDGDTDTDANTGANPSDTDGDGDDHAAGTVMADQSNITSGGGFTATQHRCY